MRSPPAWAAIAALLLTGCQDRPPNPVAPAVAAGWKETGEAPPPDEGSARLWRAGWADYARPATSDARAPVPAAGPGKARAAVPRSRGLAVPLRAEADLAADGGLATIRRLAGAGDPRSFGFKSADEVRRARRGPAIPVYYVRLDRLETYRRGADPRPLLLPSTEVAYPVLVGDEVRSALSVIRTGNRYRLFSMGDAEVLKRLEHYRRGRDGYESLVRIPALDMAFAGRTLPSGRVLLINLAGDERVTLPVGDLRPAEWFLERLAPLARDQNSASRPRPAA